MTTLDLDAWQSFGSALEFARSRVECEELTDPEAADGQRYLLRVLRAVADGALVAFDPDRPTFLPMLDSVRWLGAAGPDIDYDVAIVRPGARYLVTGERGSASYAGITVYGFAGAAGASAIVANVDIDDLARADGTFTYEFGHDLATRVIVRQYFHDRREQRRGTWTIERLGDEVTGASAGSAVSAGSVPAPSAAAVGARVSAAADSLRWNLRLNELWTPELRRTPHRFVRQTPDEIVAAVTNPDVIYAFTWWRLAADEALEIELTPPATRYWGLQLCDRWFQSYPDRRANINDRGAVAEADGTVRIVVSDGDPAAPNWLDTGGHREGVLFFRWLHADPDVLPTCRVVPRNR